MSSLHRDILKRMGGGLPPAGPLAGGFQNRAGRRVAKDYSPSSWTSYFDSMKDLKIPETNSTFRVYLSGFEDSTQYQNKPLIILLHGGGYSGLSWSTFVKNLHELCYCKIVAIDLRGHGSTHTPNDDDLSIKTLSMDVGLVYKNLMSGVEEEPSVVIMGHSMGGAIAVHTAVDCHELIPNLAGLVVIDVVEGTAIDALQGMQSVLRSRPTQFPNLSNAIEWSVRSGQTRNLESARISMPGMLVAQQTETPSAPVSSSAGNNRILEEDEEQMDESDVPKATEQNVPESGSSAETYGWRTNLFKSEVYWRGWFEGLSDLFLTASCPAKLLLLAGIDRLDRTLTVGQMQGKFQMQVLPECGHAVHEDVPDKVAEVVATFLIRNRLSSAKSDFKPTFPGC